MKRLAIYAGAVLLLVTATRAVAANSPMEECTAQWLALKAAGKTGGQAYRAFLIECLKQGPVAPVVAAKPSRSASHRTDPAKPKRPNRMQVCAAQWRDMKAGNTTNGMTYRQWSSGCLRKT